MQSLDEIRLGFTNCFVSSDTGHFRNVAGNRMAALHTF